AQAGPHHASDRGRADGGQRAARGREDAGPGAAVGYAFTRRGSRQAARRRRSRPPRPVQEEVRTEDRRRRTEDRGQIRKLCRPLYYYYCSSVLGPVSSAMTKPRTESDTFGPIDVPAERYWGAQTERSRRNFRIGEERMPMPIIRALALIKHAAADVNHALGSLDA